MGGRLSAFQKAANPGYPNSYAEQKVFVLYAVTRTTEAGILKRTPAGVGPSRQNSSWFSPGARKMGAFDPRVAFAVSAESACGTENSKEPSPPLIQPPVGTGASSMIWFGATTMPVSQGHVQARRWL